MIQEYALSANICPALNPGSSENIVYNNPLFPANVRYGILSTYPDYSAICHWHDDLEFALIKTGKMTYNVNGELIELTEGNGIMVNSRQLHYGFSAEHNECEFIYVLLSTELLSGNDWFFRNYIERITSNYAYPYLYLDRSGWQSFILKRLDKMYRSYGSNAAGSTIYYELLEDFIAIMKVLYENLDIGNCIPTKDSSELTSLKNMIRYLEEHYAERITLDAIASAGACCKSRCSLLFRKYLRDTPITYATRLRLRKSLTALLETDTGITDIAYAHGFCSASYYCEIFQKYYGISPLQYRKQQSLTTR